MDREADECMDGYGWAEGWMDEWTDEQIAHESLDRWMNGCFMSSCILQHQLRLLEAQKRNQEVVLRRKTEEVSGWYGRSWCGTEGSPWMGPLDEPMSWCSRSRRSGGKYGLCQTKWLAKFPAS